MDMDENIVINTVSTGTSSSSGRDRQRLTKNKKSRKGKIQRENDMPRMFNASQRVDGERQDETSINNEKKLSNNEKQKFSSLFRNNPDIPTIKSVEVETVREKVFSSDNFSELDINSHLVACLEKRLGATKMTAVQRESIPHILNGKDVLVKSQTGSGKTLCYAIPIVQQLQSREPKVKRTDGPFAIIISPTRELTLQSFETFQKLVRSFVWVVPGCIMGGEKKSKEKSRIRKGINILLSTPGRLLDHLYNTTSFSLENVKYLVIDEADRLLDMGFEKEISQIVTILSEKCSSGRQNILLSATLTSAVERLAGISLEDPVKIDIAEATKGSRNIKSQDKQEVFTTPENLKHHFIVVPSKLRLVTLAAFIMWKAKVLKHMLNTSISVDSGLELYKLHGDMAQDERTSVFHKFVKMKTGVLLCTDVAARGLNLENVRWIVQYNTPGNATDYIHRVGRTARIGSQGHALLFLAPSEVEYLKVLQQFHIRLSEMQVDDILKTLLIDASDWITDKKSSTTYTPQQCATGFQVKIEMYIKEDKVMRTLARKAYQSFIRSYATYPSSLKNIFHVKLLHLGHVAKSFGLQEAPKDIANVVSKNITLPVKRKVSDKVTTTKKGSKKPRMDLMSEFSSGLDDVHKSTSSKRHKQFMQQKSNKKKHK